MKDLIEKLEKIAAHVRSIGNRTFSHVHDKTRAEMATIDLEGVIAELKKDNTPENGGVASCLGAPLAFWRGGGHVSGEAFVLFAVAAILIVLLVRTLPSGKK